MNILIFDIGASQTRYVMSNGRRFLNPPVIMKTPRSYNRMKTSWKKIRAHVGNVDRVVMGAAGPLDGRHATLIGGNLPNWVHQSMRRDAEKIFRTRVILRNDAELGGLGEARYGAGQGYNVVAFLTVSTGVGGAKIVGGNIDVSARGFEPGRQIIGFRKRPLILEELISGKALKQKFHKYPWKITDQKVWQETAHWLALGLVNLSVLWSPDVIVLGGPMFKRPGIRIAEVRAELKKLLKIMPAPKILPAQLGDFCGLYGGMVAAKKSRS
ncbi:MAG: ROK family protein [Candidatus Kerfeldbacteria bacterium]|nr:ROK family protein [Candidatus Kerfeldbacteria bacterium]